ncbi:hypothetical protein Tco_0904039 [Tanacetum coccineum]
MIRTKFINFYCDLGAALISFTRVRVVDSQKHYASCFVALVVIRVGLVEGLEASTLGVSEVEGPLLVLPVTWALSCILSSEGALAFQWPSELNPKGVDDKLAIESDNTLGPSSRLSHMHPRDWLETVVVVSA